MHPGLRPSCCQGSRPARRRDITVNCSALGLGPVATPAGSATGGSLTLSGNGVNLARIKREKIVVVKPAHPVPAALPMDKR